MNDSHSRRFAIALSYPGERREYVEQVADTLAKAVTWERVLFDKYWEEEFAKFDLDVKLPNLYLKQSELIVIFLCPEYVGKHWCRLELRYIRQLIGTEDQDRIMLVSFGAPGDLSELGILRGDGFVDIGNRSPENLAALILRRAGNQKLPPLSAKPVDQPQRREGNLRHANPNFVGRADELLKLSTAVHGGKIGVIAAVHGVGGMGKTELAVSFAENEVAAFPGGLWLLNAEGQTELLPLLGELTLELELPPSIGAAETAEQQGRRVLAELNRRAQARHGSCLLILDNVSEQQLLSTPQLSNLPREQWFRMIVTTRLDKHELRGNGLAFIPVDSLLEEDAIALIRKHQAEGAWPITTAADDEAAAAELVRELGCFTLAMEAVAIYLGQHPEIRPSAYLSRLKKEGLPSVDDLGQSPDVAAQMQHREKQLALVLEVTLEKLAPAELAALEFASLLVPDAIPWPWLEDLVRMDHGEALHKEEGYPDPWMELRRRLEGMRLLTTGDHPELARLHRLIGAHLLGNCAGHVGIMREQVEDFLDRFCAGFQDTWRHDPSVLWLLKPLQETVLHIARTSSDMRLAENASILAEVEMERGRLNLALTFLELAKRVFEQELVENPDNQRARRNESILLIQLADFFAVRGKTGDVEEALCHYHRSLEVHERVLRKNPESVQAARDVSLCLSKLAEFLVRHGKLGAVEEALGYCRRSLQINQRLHQDNRDSTEAARDVSVTLSKLADFLVRRGQVGDEEEALGHYRHSLEVDQWLHRGNPKSALAARDVSVSLNKLADFLATRGQEGDADEALSHYQRSLEIDERLHHDNPHSAQAARDVLVSLERFARMLGEEESEESQKKALEYQLRSLKMALALRQANPLSFFYERTAAVSFILAGQRAQAVGEQKLANDCMAGCHGVLQEMVAAGLVLDPPMMELYKQLSGAVPTDG